MLFSSDFSITERMYLVLYEVPLSMSLLGIGKGAMFANFHVCVKSSFQHAREECESKRVYVI